MSNLYRVPKYDTIEYEQIIKKKPRKSSYQSSYSPKQTYQCEKCKRIFKKKQDKNQHFWCIQK